MCRSKRFAFLSLDAIKSPSHYSLKSKPWKGESKMAKHHLMDSTGHSTVEFDKADPAAVKEAMERFEKLVGEQKHTAANRKEGERDYTVTKTFDPTADETLFVPAMRGG